MIGVSLRSTMDIDTTIKNFNLTKEEAFNIIKKICEIDLICPPLLDKFSKGG